MEKLTRPTACDYDRARRQFQVERSGFAPSNLRLAARLLLRGLSLRRGLPRWIAARLGLPGLFGARLGLSRLLAPRFDLPRLVPRLLPRGDDIGPPGIVRPVRVVRMVRVLRMIATSPTPVVVTIVSGTFRLAGLFGRPRWARAPAAVAHIRGRNRADAADVATGDPASPVVVHGPLTLPRHEAVTVGLVAAPILEDEPGLRAVWPPVHDAGAAVVAVRVIPGIVVHDHPEADAGVVIRIPVRPAYIRVAVVAQEPRVAVVLLDIVGDDVVIPVRVPLGHDALGEVGQSDVGIAANAPVRNHAIIPVVTAFDRVV